MFRFSISTSRPALLGALALLGAANAPARAQQPDDAQTQAAALLSVPTHGASSPHHSARGRFDQDNHADAQQQARQVMVGVVPGDGHRRVADAVKSPRHGKRRRARLAVLDYDDVQTVAGRLLSGKGSD